MEGVCVCEVFFKLLFFFGFVTVMWCCVFCCLGLGKKDKEKEKEKCKKKDG